MIQRRAFIRQISLLLGASVMPFPLLSNSKNTTKMKDHKQYDVIIVGGSYAGLAAAMALGRALRNVLVIDNGLPCNIQTPYSHNFLTNDGKKPSEIATIAKEQLMKYDTVSLLNGLVVSGIAATDGYEVELANGHCYRSKKLVFATGIKDIMPAIPGFAESWGISVLHCPYCHGYEVRQQKTGILANGDVAMEFAALISNWTSDLTIYTNGPSVLLPEQMTKLQKHKIKIVEDRIARFDHDNGYINHIVFENGCSKPVSALYDRLPFLQHTSIPVDLGCQLTAEGYIKIDSANKTTVPGIFACGDNTTRMRTVANAVAMGTTTGLMVNKELIEEAF